MGKITFLVEGPTMGTIAEGGGFTATYEAADADVAKLLEAVADYYKATLVDAEGNPVTPDVPMILKAWFDGFIKQTLRHAAEYEKRKILPPPITVTGL
jgi:hypothetical protein